MGTITLFIATSLDGYIARTDGSLDWLPDQESGANEPTSYDRLIQEIDTVIMGWNTYAQITTQLSPTVWPYEGLTTYVLTHRTPPPREGIYFVSGSAPALAARLKAAGKSVWICGGGSVAQPLLAAGMIDRLHLSVIPVLLGDGIPLFGKLERDLPLRLVRAEHQQGITELVYDC